MNTILKTLAITFAAALPLILGAEFIGVTLPSFVSAWYAFAGFGLSIGALTIVADYQDAKPLKIRPACVVAARDRMSLPLAA